MVVASDRLQGQCGAADVGGKGPDLVERTGEGDEPVPRDAAVGRLHPDDAAERRRQPDRAARVGAEGQRSHRAADRRSEPPLEPPGEWARFQGLAVFLNAEFSQDDPIANSSRLTRPMRTASSARSRSMTCAS